MVLLRLAEKTTDMSQDSNDSSEKKDQTTSSFMVDTTTDSTMEMPNITKLLNRKSFSQSIQVKRQPPRPPGQAPETPLPAIQLERPVPEAPIPEAPPAPPTDATVVMTQPPEGIEAPPSSVKPGRRRKAVVKPLKAWALKELRTSADPLAQALAKLLESGVSQALFLGIQVGAAGEPARFTATAAVNAGNKSSVWSGLCWEPSVLPEIWTQLLMAGYVELPPPGTVTNLHSARNVCRAAFDLTNDECLVLARVGTPQQCRGILVLVSRKSLVAIVKQALPALGALPLSDRKSA